MVNEQIIAYVLLIKRGKMTLDDVPEQWRSQVEEVLITEEVEKY